MVEGDAHKPIFSEGPWTVVVFVLFPSTFIPIFGLVNFKWVDIKGGLGTKGMAFIVF